jgi:hypothetical protein
MRDPGRPALTTHEFRNHALRSQDWRYIRYADGGEELYDHRSDPHEWTNLADKPELEPVKTELALFLPQTDAPARKNKNKKNRNSSKRESNATKDNAAISPYPDSSVISGLTIEPERQSIGHGDNWATTWAADFFMSVMLFEGYGVQFQKDAWPNIPSIQRTTSP